MMKLVTTSAVSSPALIAFGYFFMLYRDETQERQDQQIDLSEARVERLNLVQLVDQCMDVFLHKWR